MKIDLTRLTSGTQSWAQNPSTASVIVPLSDGGPRALTGMAAAAYLFGQALTTVKYQDTLDGVQLTDGRFEFPPASGQWVTLAEVANALQYKYGVDPLIEFAPGLGLRGYSVADINRILELLNRDFADSFNIAMTGSSLAVEVVTQATVDAERVAAALISFSGKVQTNEYLAFSYDPNPATGTPVRVSATSGDLTAGVEYFVRNLGDGQYSFFRSKAAALGATSTDRVDLTSIIGSSVTVSFGPSINASNTAIDGVSFTTNPNWTTGTRVRVNSNDYGFTAGRDYFVRNLNNVYYFFYTANEAAVTPGNSPPPTRGIVDITGSAFGVQVTLATLADSPPTDFSTLLNTTSTPILAPATETELRQNLTEGGDLYTDRFGAFYLNGVRTQAMDVAVTSRLLVQDNVSAEYKTLMDELAERNNLIAAARTVLGDGSTPASLGARVASLAEQYGMADVLSELTAGQYTDDAFLYRPTSTTFTITTFAGPQLIRGVVFSSATDPAWDTGTRVRATTTGGGLTAGTDYFVSNYGGGQYSLRSDSSTGPTISITDPIGALAIPDSTATPTSNLTLAGIDVDTAIGTPTGGNYISGFGVEALGPTGTRVRVSADGGGLFAGRDYFLYRYIYPSSNQTRFEFYDTAANADNARNGGTSGRITLTNSISKVSSRGEVTFSTDPGWTRGTRVQASITGGGLTAGKDYFVRNLFGGKYSFFDTADNANAPYNITTGLVILTAPITATIRNTTSETDYTAITALLNTLISNKVRDGDLDQAKLQTLTAQLQNNTEAMTALIKAFTDMNAQLARAL